MLQNGWNPNSKRLKGEFYDLPYSSDIVTFDNHLFRSMTHSLDEQHFHSYEDDDKRIDSWLASKDVQFFRPGIEMLPERREKVVANDGQYFQWYVLH